MELSNCMKAADWTDEVWSWLRGTFWGCLSCEKGLTGGLVVVMANGLVLSVGLEKVVMSL